MVQRPRKERDRTKIVHGVCIHTTGVGVLSARDPVARALELYTTKSNPFPHYVLAPEGDLIQVAAESVCSWHAGIAADERKAYANGSWLRQVGRAALSRWRLEFPGMASPIDLIDGNDPNQAYISIELIPQADATFLDCQYEILSLWVRDVWERHDLPQHNKWEGPPIVGHWIKMRRAGRLVGHEDVEPLTRWNRAGGWDPGALRAVPRFDWNKLIALCESTHATVNHGTS